MRIALQHHRQAARLRARRSSIRLADAVHIATAQALSCGFFVSRDRRLQTVEGIRMLAQGKANVQAPWLGITGFFAVAILLSLLIFIGEAVRDAFDPRKTFR